MNKETGGNAFPMIRDMRHNPDWDYHEGMTLRDYFAAKAMQGMLACYRDPVDSPENRRDISARLVANRAYEFADAMLEARK